MSWLFQMAGVTSKKAAALAKAGAEVPEEVRAALVSAAGRFLVSGGRWSARDFAALSRLEQSAAEVAGERYLAALALQGAAATRGGVEEAEVAAAIDGGATLRALEAQAGPRALAEMKQYVHAAMAQARSPKGS